MPVLKWTYCISKIVYALSHRCRSQTLGKLGLPANSPEADGVFQTWQQQCLCLHVLTHEVSVPSLWNWKGFCGFQLIEYDRSDMMWLLRLTEMLVLGALSCHANSTVWDHVAVKKLKLAPAGRSCRESLKLQKRGLSRHLLLQEPSPHCWRSSHCVQLPQTGM